MEESNQSMSLCTEAQLNLVARLKLIGYNVKQFENEQAVAPWFTARYNNMIIQIYVEMVIYWSDGIKQNIVSLRDDSITDNVDKVLAELEYKRNPQ